eukprot:8075033-Pyramimonas_sp.AAC.1
MSNRRRGGHDHATLIESLGTAIASATDPPGDAERVLRTSEPEQRPGWDTGEGEQSCTICAGELNGLAETLVLCGHRFHKHCLDQWRLSQPG